MRGQGRVRVAQSMVILRPSHAKRCAVCDPGLQMIREDEDDPVLAAACFDGERVSNVRTEN